MTAVYSQRSLLKRRSGRTDNGLKRSRDRSELGFERYLGLAILGRRIHVLGKLLIAQRKAEAASAFSKRKAA